jgi:hypothetical protein
MSKKIENGQGECLCGSVSYQVSGDITGFFLCHCERCQKSTGSCHASNTFLEHSTLTWTSGEALVRQYIVPKTRFIKNFCGVCGSPLPVILIGEKRISVPAGTLVNFDDLEPTAHIYMQSRKVWEEKLSNATKFDALPV